MPHTPQEIFELARQLPSSERVQVADWLYESLDIDGTTDPNGDLNRAWNTELARRIAELESGDVKGVPWEQVRSEMYRRLSDDKTP